MARKEGRYSNRLVLVMVIAVLVLSVFSVSLYVSGNSGKTSLEDNKDRTPLLKTQGVASLTILKPDPENEKEFK